MFEKFIVEKNNRRQEHKIALELIENESPNFEFLVSQAAKSIVTSRIKSPTNEKNDEKFKLGLPEFMIASMKRLLP